MSAPQRHVAEHARVIAAPPAAVYDLVADVRRWPAVFRPTVHVDHLGWRGQRERFQLWALVGDQVKTWTSARALDPHGPSIGFEQERSAPPIASMGGKWLFRALPNGRTEVLLRHHFAAVDDDQGAVEWITNALDRNSDAELAALARIAELGHPIDDVVFSFADSIRVPGAGIELYDFIERADAWPRRLPHVERVTLEEGPGGVQMLEMDTMTSGGNTHTTRSIRICLAPELIAYKQLVPPALLLGHSGSWSFATVPDGTGQRDALVTATHTAVLNPAMVADVVGASATIADARGYVRDAIGANSRATLAHARDFAIARRGDTRTGAPTP